MINKQINILGGQGPYNYTITYYYTCIQVFDSLGAPIPDGSTFSIGNSASTSASFNIQIDGCTNNCSIPAWVNIQVSWTDEEGQICSVNQTITCDDISVDIVCDMAAEFTPNGNGEYTVRFKSALGDYLSRDDVFDLVELHNYILDVYNRTDPSTTLTVGGSSAFTGILQGTLNLLYTVGNNFNYENTSSDNLVDNISFTNNNNILEINFKLKDLSGELPMAYMLYKSYGENQPWTSLPILPVYTPANFNGNNSGLPQGSARFCPLIGLSTGLEYTNLLKMCDGDCFEFTNHPLVPCNTEWAVVNLPCAGIVPIDLNDCTPDQIRVDYYNWNGANRYTIIVNGVEVAKSPWQSLRAFPSQIDQYFSIVADCEAEDETNFNNTIFVTLSPSDTFSQYLGVFTDLHGWEINPSNGLTTYNFIDGGNPATYNLSLLPDHHFYYINLPPANPNFPFGPTQFGSLIWTNDNNETVNSLEIKVDTEYSDATYNSFYVHCPTCISCDLVVSAPDIVQCTPGSSTVTIDVGGIVIGSPLTITLNGTLIHTQPSPIATTYQYIYTGPLNPNNIVGVNQDGCSSTEQFTFTVNEINIDVQYPNTICEGEDLPITIASFNDIDFDYSYTIDGGFNGVINSSPFNISIPPAYTAGSTPVIVVYIQNNEGCIAEETLNITIESCPGPELTCQGPNDVNMLECTPQSQVENTFTAWLGQFSYTAINCPAVTETWTIGSQSYTNVNDIPLIEYCGQSVTVDYQVEGCGLSSSCMATFFTPPPATLNAICPAPITLNNPTQPQLDSEFDTWINSFSYIANCDPIEGYEVTEVYVPTVDGVRGNPTALVDIVPPPITGGVLEVEYEISDPCGQSATCVSIFTVECTPNADVQALIVPPYVYTTDPCNSYIFGLGSGLSGENADGVINAVNNCNCGCTVSSTFRATNTITVWNAITKDTQLHSNTETGQGGGNACGTGAGTNVSPTIDITTIQGKYFEQVLTNPYISGTEGCNLNTLELLGIYDPDNLYTVVASEALLLNPGDVFVDSSNFMIKGYLPSDLTGGATCP